MTDEKLSSDFAGLPPAVLAEIEGLAGVGLHHAPAALDHEAFDEVFHHPERDAAGTTWEPNWEPINTYREGDIVMLDDGSRQLLGRREMGMWIELVDGEELAQPDYQPMLWSDAPDQVKRYDVRRPGTPQAAPAATLVPALPASTNHQLTVEPTRSAGESDADVSL